MQDDVMSRLDSAFGPVINAMNERKTMAAAQAAIAPDVAQTPVDYYQQGAKAASEIMRKPFLNGSTQKLNMEVESSLSALKGAYERNKDIIKRLEKVGDKQRADIVRNQYMQEVFLPVVESIVMTNSPEELLNAPKALAKLDEYAMVNGGLGSGYTASFVRNLHSEDFGGVIPTSDANVANAIRDIKRLVADCQIRSAVGIAQKIKRRIDNGEVTASDEDYDIIQRVALRG